MKPLRLFPILMLALLVSTQCAVAQSEQKAFFKHKECLPCRVIAQLYSPDSEFINGWFEISDWDWDAGGVSSGIRYLIVKIGLDDGSLVVQMHRLKDRYDKIDIVPNGSCSTEWTKSKEVLDSFIKKMQKDFKQSEIAWIQRKMGKSLSEMVAEELCLAYLSILYWKFDYIHSRG